MTRWAAISASRTWHRRAPVADRTKPRFGPRARRGDGARRGLTLFEVVVALALLAALAGIIMPLMLDRTRDLSFDETVLQLEQAASVARAESQRESEAVLFEVRWSAGEGAYRVGTAKLGEPGESAGEADVVNELPRLSGKETGMGESPADLPSFQALLTLPSQYQIRRRIPEEYFEAAGVAAGLPEEPSAGFAGEGADAEDWGLVGVWGDPPRPQRVIIAVFLPDGTLMGDERLYLLGPGQRVAAITTNRWLGAVKVERVLLQVPGSEEAEGLQEDRERGGAAAPEADGSGMQPALTGQGEDRP